MCTQNQENGYTFFLYVHSQVVAERVDVGGRLVYLDIAVQDVENIGMK